MTREIPGWEPVEPGAPNASQIVDGQWHFPLFGCDSLQMALDELAADWISVWDRLPEDGQKVLIWQGEYVEIAFFSLTANEHAYWRTSGGWPFQTRAIGVTHWMPAPPPPEPAP